MRNEFILDKEFANDFLNRYGDVVAHWRTHGDPLKRGFAILLNEAASGEVVANGS